VDAYVAFVKEWRKEQAKKKAESPKSRDWQGEKSLIEYWKEKERKKMKTILKNVVFSNPSKSWNVQVNLFRFNDQKKIHWIYSSASIMRKTWATVNPNDLPDFYDWVHSSVDGFVAHVENRN
jgi:hypothetical protein